ncbi:hypothetical protein H0H93_003323 [Arthromyces matolae]|nr:hypothetical protein H0H93_003323 [Arthromyces matolae]
MLKLLRAATRFARVLGMEKDSKQGGAHRFTSSMTPRKAQGSHGSVQAPRRTAAPNVQADIKSSVCWEFKKTGTCRFGKRCKFIHEVVQVGSEPVENGGDQPNPRRVENMATMNDCPGPGEGPSSQSNEHKPASSDIEICRRWKAGTCQFGDKCRYKHEDATSNDERNVVRVPDASGRRNGKTQRAQVSEQRRQAAQEAAQRREAQRMLAEQRAAEQREALAREEAARKAHLAEQEALRMEREAAVTSQHVVLGSSLVTFGAGLGVQSLICGFNSCDITIKNLPSDAKAPEITELFTQQGMNSDDIHVPSIQRTDDGHLEAKVLTSSSEGRLIAIGLDGIEFRDEKLKFEIKDVASANAMGEFNKRPTDTLTISWFAPSLTMIATYDSLQLAREKRQALDRQIIGNRRVKVEMNLPPTGRALLYYNPASVKIMGLPIDATVETVAAVAGTLSIRVINSTPYDLSEMLRDLRHHFLTHPHPSRPYALERLTEREIDGIVTMKARFSNWDDANNARASLEGNRLRPQYPVPRLLLPPPLEFRSTIPMQQYQAQRHLWDTLAEGKSDKARIHIDHPPDREVAFIRLSGEDKKLVGGLKVRMETLIAGEKLDATYWHRSFLSLQGRQFLARVSDTTKAYIRIEFKSRSLKLFGRGEAKERARQMIEEEVARLSLQEWTVLLKRQMVGYFIRRGLADLKEVLGETGVLLDLTSTPCKLTIRGGEEARHALTNVMDQALNNLEFSSFDSENGICPICYDAISNPFPLGCRHVYCTGCIRHYITTAPETKIFPIACLGDEGKCKVPISIPVIQRFLIPQQYENLINIAVSSYLEQRPQEFRYAKMSFMLRRGLLSLSRRGS